MVAQRYDLRLETRESRVRTLPWAASSRGHGHDWDVTGA